MKINILLISALILAIGSINFAQSGALPVPGAIIRNVYAADTAGKNPFSGTNPVKYFTDDLIGAMINTGTGSNGEGQSPEAVLTAGENNFQTKSDIRSVDFLNYSYRSSTVCSEDAGLPRTIKVSGGEFRNEHKFYDVAENEIGYGDITGDKREDAVVQIRCGSTAGTFRAFELHAYTFQKGRAKILARLDSGVIERDYKKAFPKGVVFFPGEKAPKIENGRLIFQAFTDGSFASPANIATFTYKLSGGKFIISGKPVKKRFVSSDSKKATQKLKIYLVAVDDNGKKGKKIGCGDSLVPVTRTVKANNTPLTDAIKELLSIRREEYSPKLENFWEGPGRQVKSVSIQNGTAIISLTGEAPSVGGVCTIPRIEMQIIETAMQFSTVKRVKVFINGKALKDLIK